MKMQKDKLLVLAAFIETLPRETGRVAPMKNTFDMKTWKTPRVFGTVCGTVACIGGWAMYLYEPGHQPDLDGDLRAARLLGLQRDVAHRLFYPVCDAGWKATPKQAAAVIRHLVETGKVDWTVGASE